MTTELYKVNTKNDEREEVFFFSSRTSVVHLLIQWKTTAFSFLYLFSEIQKKTENSKQTLILKTTCRELIEEESSIHRH